MYPDPSGFIRCGPFYHYDKARRYEICSSCRQIWAIDPGKPLREFHFWIPSQLTPFMSNREVLEEKYKEFGLEGFGKYRIDGIWYEIPRKKLVLGIIEG